MMLKEGLEKAIKQDNLIERIRKARGLGSSVEEITKSLGIKPCGGCKKRRDWLDRRVPFKRDNTSSS